MANPTCTVASFATGAACFKNYPYAQRYAILVYYNALELAAIGGTLYTLGSDGTLQAAAVCYKNLDFEGCPPTVFDLLIAYNNALAAGAAVAAPATDALAAAIQCNKNFSIADHQAQILFLQCSLGVHKAYPQ